MVMKVTRHPDGRALIRKLDGCRGEIRFIGNDRVRLDGDFSSNDLLLIMAEMPIVNAAA